MELYTVQEVADKLKVDNETVRRWLRKKELKGIKLGNKWRIKKKALENFINQKE